MKLKDILKVKGSKVWMIKSSQSIHEALQILVTQKIGALLVLDEKKESIIGILSERDIVRGCYARLKKMDKAPVSDFMTRKIVTASPEDDIRDIMAVMTQKRVRHIPVLEDNKLYGIVSIGDVVKALLEDSEHEIRHLKEYMFGSIL